jgi:hypothetical protein
MNFNALVNHIVKESLAVNIPVLDGKREIWHILIDEYLIVSGVSRASKIIESKWDACSSECNVSDYHQALHMILDHYKQQSFTSEHINFFCFNLQLRMSKLEHVIGQWKVMDTLCRPIGAHTQSIRVGVEVNLDYYKTPFHAAEELRDF